MADTIPCSSGESCNCACNCHAYLLDGRLVTVGDLIVDVNDYTFNYTISNQDPDLSFVVFCIQCPISTIVISNLNTSIQITGNPSGTPVVFTECFTPGCQSLTTNSFYVDYDISNEMCCRYQGFKIELNTGDTIDEVALEITFTLPVDVIFGFNAGNMKIKTGQIVQIINDLCMPGCFDDCDIQTTICRLWRREENILESNKDIFIHLAQLILPEILDLSTLTISQLETKIRLIAKQEKSTACLICNTSKVLEKLNDLDNNGCCM